VRKRARFSAEWSKFWFAYRSSRV